MTTVRKQKIIHFLTNYMTLICFAALFIYNSIATPNFFSWITARNLINQSTSLILVSFGAMIVISSGNIDISLGSGFCWGAIVFAIVTNATGSVVLGLIIAVLSAAVIGIINGTLVGRFGIQSMIVTMAMMYILRSVSEAVTKCASVRFDAGFISDMIVAKIFGDIPAQLFLLIIVTLIMFLIVKHARLGVYFEACGDNLVAAKTAGIRANLYIVVAYVIGNVLACLGGIYDTAVVSSVNPTNVGLEFEFRAIAAVVIGGTSISGGHPNIIGTVFGVLILKLISMMIQMNNVTSEWSYVITALIIIVSILIQNFDDIRRKK